MTSTSLVSAVVVFRPAWRCHRRGSRGPSAHCCLLQLMQFISVSDFGLWKQNTEERGVADSRSAKTTGVYIFLGYTWHARGLRFSPCKLTTDQDPRSYEPPSAVSMHPSLKAKLTRSDATDVRQGAPQLKNSDADRRAGQQRQEPRSRVPTDKGGDCTTKSASHSEPAK